MPDWDSLKKWFLQKKRPLPWREEKEPYKVWISEIMLQQTQVRVVLPYFKKWMQEFPTLPALAKAPLDKIIKCWEGLGYYSRAKNLKKGAQYILENFNGHLPQERKELLKIPGIGPYTAGAILAFGFHQKAAAMDGNVSRVMARYIKLEEDIMRSKTQEFLRQHLESLLPDHEPWILTEALIELGALICKKKPACLECPLKEGCIAFKENLTEKLPVRKAPPQTTQLFRIVTIIQHDRHFLIKQVPEGQVMGGLYEFPFLEKDSLNISEKDLIDDVQAHLRITVQPLRRYPIVKHGFTRFNAHLEPILCAALKRKACKNYTWVSKDQLASLPFSSGHRQVLHKFLLAS